MSEWETIDFNDHDKVKIFLERQTDRIIELEDDLKSMWTAKEIRNIIDDTNKYVQDCFYEKMTYSEVASLNMFVMLLIENLKEKQREKEDD